MYLKKRIGTLFVVVLVGCGSSKTPINEFERILGEENSKELTELVQTFENRVLSTNYSKGNLTKRYLEFSNRCNKVGADKALPNVSDSFQKFRNTQMWNEVFAQIDSTWTSKFGGLTARVIYNSERGIQEIGTTGTTTKDISDLDSLNKAVLKWQVWNHQGKYIKALRSVKEHNLFIEEYYKGKTTYGELSSLLFCDMILRHKPDFEDYLVKRVIAIELARIYIK